MKKQILTVGGLADLLQQQLETGQLSRKSTVILSLTGSEIEDANVNAAACVSNNGDGPDYLELRCKHPDVTAWQKEVYRLTKAIDDFLETIPTGVVMTKGNFLCNYKAYLKLCKALH
jgi:hypothetical protein